MTGYCKQDVRMVDTKELCFIKGKEYNFTTREEHSEDLEDEDFFYEFDDMVAMDECGCRHGMTLGFYNRHFSTI